MIYLTIFVVSLPGLKFVGLSLPSSLTSLSLSLSPGYYNPHAHIFCDCDICRDEWGGMDFTDIVGSDSDLYSDEDDDDFYSYGADDR